MRSIGLIFFFGVSGVSWAGNVDLCNSLASFEYATYGKHPYSIAFLDEGSNDVLQVSRASKVIEAGDTAGALLVEAGWLPDMNNVALMQALNPEIVDIDRLKVGQLIEYPEVIKVRPEFYAAANRTDFKQIEGWGKGNNTGIDGYIAWAQLSDYMVSTFDQVDASRVIENEISALKRENHEVLKQPEWETVLNFQRALGDVPKVSTGTALNVADFNQFSNFAAAIRFTSFIEELDKAASEEDALVEQKQKLRQYALLSVSSFQMKQAKFTVKTKHESGEELNNLTVYRVSRASYDADCIDENKIKFDTRSYEATAKFPPVEWWIWTETNEGKKSKLELVNFGASLPVRDFIVRWEVGNE